MIEIDIVGQTGSHKSTQYSSELTRNMYLDYSETTGLRGCHDFPGLKAFGTGTGADRGHHVMNGVHYVINGTSLFSESSTGVRTSLGTIAGTDRAIFSDDGTNLYLTANNTLYKYNGSTVSTVTQSVVTNPSSITYINTQFIITGDNGLFGVSDPDDGDTYNALNYSEEDTKPDGLLRAYYFNQLIYMCGAETVVPYYNSGVGNPPFARQDTSLVNFGVAGKHAVTDTGNFLYFLGDDRKVYKCIGSTAKSVNTSGISHLIENFNLVSDCIASAFVLNGQDFVLFKFPTAAAALVYSETNDYWIELSAGTDLARQSWYGNSVIRCYDKNLVSDYRNGNTYELDFDTYTDNGDARLRIRTLPSFTGKMIGKPGRQVTASRLQIDMQTGVGLASGQGSSPVLMCQFSPEGGEVWGAVQHVDIGAMGEYKKSVDLWDFATGYEVKARIMISDPVPLSLYGARVDLKDAGF